MMMAQMMMFMSISNKLSMDEHVRCCSVKYCLSKLQIQAKHLKELPTITVSNSEW